MKPETIGHRIGRARRAYGDRLNPPRDFRKSDLADALGVSSQALGHWEGDSREPDLKTIRQIADVLGVRAAWLAFGEEPMRAEDLGTVRALAREFPNHGARDADVFLDDLDTKQREAETAKKKSPRRRAQ